MKFTIFQESRIGNRKTNQDRTAYCYSRDALLMVIADGMGGHLHGEIAAQIAVQFIAQSFQREAHPALHDPIIFLSRTLNRAHDAILDYAFDKQLSEAPRTTVVVCIIQDGFAYWAHAGDSRLYLLRRNRIVAQTRDHSRVQLMMDQGLLDANDAASHPGRNRIYSCLGGSHPPQIEFSKRVALRDGDIIMLATDGLWGPLGDASLISGMGSANLAENVPKLLTLAEEKAGKNCDNLSMVAMAWQDEATFTEFDAISTATMDLNHVRTKLDMFGQSRSTIEEFQLSDEEIEKAIQEINSAIQKFSKQD